jgi:Y-X(10)_GDL-associated radical SAM protein
LVEREKAIVSSMPKRLETSDDYRRGLPVHVVWEITAACNLKCTHCGSRAGRRRPNELSTEECLDLIAQYARLGIRQVSLIGGEAYLRRDWLDLIRAIRAHGMDCSMQSGARALTPARVRAAADAGLQSCGISIDGLRALHDELRGVPGSWDQAIAALQAVRACGLVASVSTQITTRVLPELRDLLQVIAAAGVAHWQLALTVAMGNAADRPELVLQPYQLLDLMPLLAELHDEALAVGLLMHPANNIGYFGPYEHRWRVTDDAVGHWQGCAAGHTTLGVEADGTVKGCPSLPTQAYAGGNIRDLTIEQMWEHSSQLRFTRDRNAGDLWGFCRDCYYADVCRAGCTWTAHSLFGRAGNNPFCHYRALTLSRQGLRERIVKIGDAPGTPFDHGRFALIVESIDGSAGSRVETAPPPTIQVRRRAEDDERVPPVLVLCRGCDQYVYPDTAVCPHCGARVAEVAIAHAAAVAEARAALDEVRQLLQNSPR